MLSAAQREHKAGRQVLVGVLWKPTAAAKPPTCWPACPQLPLREVPYRGRVLREFDLDAALGRKPEVLLVDELAHSNVEGSRHPKRWQDVQELLEAGIDVWSALNVQHLESLNGTVGAITGIRVNETVPDTVLDAADEIILVDVTPDELMNRLKAGKVYLAQQADRAMQNFFRKGNLIALREIALRRTAEHVEDDVRSYRVEQSIAPVWNTEGAILACIGPRDGSEQTVRAAARLAGQLNVRWYTAYVETPALQRLAVAQRDRILAVLKLAEELGAETAVLAGSDCAHALVAHAQKLNCAILVVGRPRPSRLPWGLVWPTLTRRLANAAPALDLVEVGQPRARAGWAAWCSGWQTTKAQAGVQAPPGPAMPGPPPAAWASPCWRHPCTASWTWPTSSCCSCWERWAWPCVSGVVRRRWRPCATWPPSISSSCRRA